MSRLLVCGGQCEPSQTRRMIPHHHVRGEWQPCPLPSICKGAHYTEDRSLNPATPPEPTSSTWHKPKRPRKVPSEAPPINEYGEPEW